MPLCPPRISDAKVLWFTPIDHRHEHTGSTVHSINGARIGLPAGLAICQYEHHEGGFYLFNCDENWETETDTWHESIEHAKEQAEFEFKGAKETWIQLQEQT
jgi:hypothetical protein